MTGHEGDCSARFLTPGEAGIMVRLRDEAKEIAVLQRRLAAMKRRRDLLIVKAVRCGLSERTIATVAGVTNVRCGQIARAHPSNKASREGS